MIGAMIGDMAGSYLQSNSHGHKSPELFGDGCFAAKDSFVTLAAAKAIMEAEKSAEQDGSDDAFDTGLSGRADRNTREICRRHPDRGFDSMFRQWVFSDDPKPNDGRGSEAALRAIPAGFAAKDRWDAESSAGALAAAGNGREEEIEGAKAVAAAIAMARDGALKREIREYVASEYHSWDPCADGAPAPCRLRETCRETVARAIECFLEAASFEDAVRRAVSPGVDGSAIGAITGAIAEAYYGVPDVIMERALGCLDGDLRVIFEEWASFAPPCREKFRVLTKYIGKLSAVVSIGGWIIDIEDDCTPERPVRFPYKNRSVLAADFTKEFHGFSEAHPEYGLTGYRETLERNGLYEPFADIRSMDLDRHDERCVLALIMFAIRAERSSEGALQGFMKDGSLLACLKRLKDMDWLSRARGISGIEFDVGGFFGGSTACVMAFSDNGARMDITHGRNREPSWTTHYPEQEAASLQERFRAIHTEYWDTRYCDPFVLDGEQWSLTVRYSDGLCLCHSGSNAYPGNWKELLRFFDIDISDDDDGTGPRPGEIIYCSVSFDGGKTYWYTTDDESVEIGDAVIVPVGVDNTELTGEVVDIGYFLPGDAPFPLERTKAVIRKASGDEGGA